MRAAALQRQIEGALFDPLWHAAKPAWSRPGLPAQSDQQPPDAPRQKPARTRALPGQVNEHRAGDQRRGSTIRTSTADESLAG
ncbi:MAG TPA: hypothetical protein VLB05_17245 [Dongiaceae bacterium]|nr:hypothetical protein [Dongiaceae bacterium]